MSDPLFRKEAVERSTSNWLGAIILARPVSITVFATAAAATTVALCSLFYWGTYTRKVSLTGQLVPAQGLLKVYTPQSGIVVERHVSEEDSVQKGQLLFTVTTDRMNGTQGVQQAISDRVGQRGLSLKQEAEGMRTLHRHEREELISKVGAVQAEIGRISQQLGGQQQRISLSRNSVERYAALLKQEYITSEQLEIKQADLLDQEYRLQTLQRDRASAERELVTMRHQLQEMAQKHAAQMHQIERSLLSNKQELMESEAKRHVFIVAPESGIAATVLAEPGQLVDPSRMLLSIVPRGAALQASLYAPSSAIGFIRIGGIVHLRYQAFPYQKFGQHPGKIVSISRNAMSTSELSVIAGGIPGLDNLKASELYYRITVELETQRIEAYSEFRELQTGMVMDASLPIDNRRIYEWVLEPLFALKKRLEV